MKLKHKSDRSLESLTVFPYVAWGLTFVFAYFVYTLATDLQETAERLQIQVESLEQKTHIPAEDIRDFESLQ